MKQWKRIKIYEERAVANQGVCRMCEREGAKNVIGQRPDRKNSKVCVWVVGCTNGIKGSVG